ncbi:MULTISPECIES: DNA alkylation repair protein [unclassified Anabaena]|uniref:DNA alkylation repair protein n=1 Tax=unclassified Anabaena TaxID=2619674 RepID=UPI0039C714B7
MNQIQAEKLQLRKGARKRSEIPDEVLQSLNQGKIETVNLVEWLAIDMSVLLKNILMELDLADVHRLHITSAMIQNVGIIKRLQGIGEALFHVLKECDNRLSVFEFLANHPSDMVRDWACFTVAADKFLSLPERLQATRRFAGDGNMSVRECAWESLRSYLVEDLEYSLNLLLPWVKDPDLNIRRCAVEATRPCGVWCKHILALKEHPEPGLIILEEVRSDASNYVQRSVANWLNDASKTRPDWVINVCDRWQKESPTQATNWIVKHATRTLSKKKKK